MLEKFSRPKRGRKPILKASIVEAMDRPKGCLRWMTKPEIERAVGYRSSHTYWYIDQLIAEGRLEVREWSNRFTEYRLRDEA